MSWSLTEYYAREAARLRAIIDALAFVEPQMPLEDAAPLIFKIEEEAFDRECRQLPSRHFELPNAEKETVAQFVDLQLDIQKLIRDGIKINAIKEVRARTGIGLKEAKDGVEYWASSRTFPSSAAPPAPASSSFPAARPAPPLSPAPGDVALWIDGQPSVIKLIEDAITGRTTSGKIHAIKEVRALGAIGLKEAKEGVEEWQRTRRPGT